MAYLATEQDGKIIRTIWMVQQGADGKGKWIDDYHFQAPMHVLPPAYVNNYDPSKLKNKYVEGETP